MKPAPTCPNCGSPMWRVIVEDSVKGTASHFECFFHIDEKPMDPPPHCRTYVLCFASHCRLKSSPLGPACGASVVRPTPAEARSICPAWYGPTALDSIEHGRLWAM
jgi:hypothetical protein